MLPEINEVAYEAKGWHANVNGERTRLQVTAVISGGGHRLVHFRLQGMTNTLLIAPNLQLAVSGRWYDLESFNEAGIRQKLLGETAA